jgi:plasmid stability protein
MGEATVTLTLPQAVYAELQERADRHHRPVEDEAGIALEAAVHATTQPQDDPLAVTNILQALDSDSLWRISCSQPTVEDGVLLDALVDKRRRQGLTVVEEHLVAELVDRHDRIMVLRAEAVALLHERGIDVHERVKRA